MLTAKHGCGFLLWETNSTLPDGSPYPYHVGNSKLGRNVAQEYSDIMAANDLGHGFYYSLTNNYFLNLEHYVINDPSTLLPGMANVTVEEFEVIAKAQLRELWGSFGDLTEIWFDGGYTDSMKGDLTDLLKELQPDAAGFGGHGLMPNPVQWVGTESGLPGTDSIWSAQDFDGDGPTTGSPDGGVFAPKGCDTTLQNDDQWFFYPEYGIRELDNLKNVYHQTVGNNGVLEIDFAVDRTGNVDAAHAARYKELGDWSRACYNESNFVASGEEAGIAPIVVDVKSSDKFDRFLIREDMSKVGQAITNFDIYGKTAGGDSFDTKLFSSGDKQTGIGNKKILLLDDAVSGLDQVKFVVTESLIDNFGAVSFSVVSGNDC